MQNREKLYNICSCSGSLAGIFWCVLGASAQSCGLVGICQSLTGAFFTIGANLEGGADFIGVVLQNYHARSKWIML